MTVKEIFERSKYKNIIVHCNSQEIAKSFLIEFYTIFYPSGQTEYYPIIDSCTITHLMSWINYKNKLCYNIRNGQIESSMPIDYINKYGLDYEYELTEYEEEKDTMKSTNNTNW